MDLLACFRTYVRVVETGSFTSVAAELNTTQPTISRQVAALEEHLGARLMTRTTRQLTLTDDGRVLYEQARRLLEAADEAQGAVGRRKGKPSGTLRPCYARRVRAPARPAADCPPSCSRYPRF
jgi:DNA-binding transcriptional LysR family regulator